MKTDKKIMFNIFLSLQVAISKQDCPSRVLCGMKKALVFPVCYLRAEMIPAVGTLPACIDGVSLFLDKNF